MPAPIIVFAYNRPDHLRSTLVALSKNDLADQSELTVFCDGPKEGASDVQLAAIQEVRNVAHEKQWCKNVSVIEAAFNLGLADSIVRGVTSIVEKYGRVIVLEDDIITSKGFLRYMNDALEMYESDERVMHISGYMYPHKGKLANTFFCALPLCWGWATWKRAWKLFDDDTQKWITYYEHNNLWNRFNVFGGDILQKQLEDNSNGIIKTWFVKWHSCVLFNDGLALFPGCSLVNNIGMDGTGEHCSQNGSFSNSVLAEYVKVDRIPLRESQRGRSAIFHFYQGYWYSKRNRIKVLKAFKELFVLR